MTTRIESQREGCMKQTPRASGSSFLTWIKMRWRQGMIIMMKEEQEMRAERKRGAKKVKNEVRQTRSLLSRTTYERKRWLSVKEEEGFFFFFFFFSFLLLLIFSETSKRVISRVTCQESEEKIEETGNVTSETEGKMMMMIRKMIVSGHRRHSQWLSVFLSPSLSSSFTLFFIPWMFFPTSPWKWRSKYRKQRGSQ